MLATDVGTGERDDLCGRRVGEFILRERIGEGGFGAVYRCEQPLLGREAVIKVLHHRLRHSEVVLQRFMREAQLASLLDHPYAAHIYAFGVEDDGLVWIAMEMVRGTALDRWLDERGPLPLDQLVPLFERIAEVVQTAHERNIVHRDLKPSNIMVIERAGRLLPKLLDFGIAKLFDANAPLPPPRPSTPDPTARTIGAELPEPTRAERAEAATLPPGSTPESASAHLTQTNATIGSPPYMSPEQWSDTPRVGPQADLYALGIVAYEALTGRRPFTATTIAGYADLHCTSAVPPLGNKFPPALDRFFERALAKQPEDRPGTALELAAMLGVAAGLARPVEQLPRLDETVRDAWLADAPQPLAEAIAALDGARNVHQARDAARDVYRSLVRYLTALAIAGRAQVRPERDDPALLELLRALRQRDLDDGERGRLLRLLTRPFVDRAGAHPVPELVALVATAGPLDAIGELHATSDAGASEDLVRSHLARIVPTLARLLRACAFVLDYPLIVPADGGAERWTGLRRTRRALAVVRGSVVDRLPVLVDQDGVPVLQLWPLIQPLAPTPGAELELFVFDGRGRHGARLTASPSGFEHHDPSLWDWFAERVLDADDADRESGGATDAPYLGLAAFSAADADRFVGREREIDAFMNRLRRQALLVVVGASGAGKSSFVHAGVVPALPPGWRAITMRPGATPIATLTAKLVSHAAGDGATVIVVDQLEELFTLCDDQAERERFAALLASLATSPDAPTRVICTVRDDFLMRVDELPPLRKLVSPALFLLGNPSRDDLVRTVVEPAKRAGYALSDPDLALDMVDAVANRPGALALLSFTAARLWELRDRSFRQLTRRAYEAMGGVGGALGQHAEDVFAAFAADEQRLVRDVFRHLITADGTRAVMDRAELRAHLASAHADDVIDKLVAARLLSIVDDGGQLHIEIIHEALIAAWPRLERWSHEDADDARMREQLRVAVKQWDDRGRPRGLLWRDDILDDLDKWRRRPGVALSEHETAFADASRIDARRAQRIRRIVAAVAFVVLGATSFVMFALRQNAAESAMENRRSHQLALEEHGRELFLAGDPIRAMVYVDAAAKAGATDPVVRYLSTRIASQLAKKRFDLAGHKGPVWRVAFTRDGTTMFTAGADGTARAWNAATGQALRTYASGSGHIVAMDISPDERLLISAGEDGKARIWEIATGRLLHVLSAHKTWIFATRFSLDGARAVTASGDGTACLWDVASGALVATLDGHPGGVDDAVFAHDGSVFTAGDDHRIVHWDATGRRLAVLERHRAEVTSLSLSRDGRVLASGGNDGSIVIWSAADGSFVRQIDLQAIPTLPALSPDGSLIAVPAGKAIQIWPTADGPRRAMLEAHAEVTTSVAFSPGGVRIASTSNDGTVRLWDVASGGALATIPTGDTVAAAAFAPDGAALLTGGGNGAQLWDARNDVLVHRLPAGAPVKSAAWAGPDRVVACNEKGVAHVWRAGNLERDLARGESPCFVAATDDAIATGADDGTLELWDAATGRLRTSTSCGHAVTALAFSADGNRLLVACDRELAVRDAHTLAVLRPIAQLAQTVRSVAWSADGKTVASCGRDVDAHSWDVDSGTPRTFPVDEHCYKVAFSPDGRRLGAVTRKTVRLWDLAANATSALVGHHNEVGALAFVDIETIVTRAQDKTAGVWVDNRLVDLWPHPDGSNESANAPEALAIRGRDVVTVSGTDVLVWRLPAPVEPATVDAVVRALPFQLRDDVLTPR